ncbi:CHAT domain-containing protein [Streptomyces hoynatensis]|uniref:CHAT domain-containing protein n=1 Tax=Streptomyces hoynatensis TaxID=1141874 RepID=UPI00131A2DC0|nr:CHAT domain-containing protein [Streptomyces hoynatensis]
MTEETQPGGDAGLPDRAHAAAHRAGAAADRPREWAGRPAPARDAGEALARATRTLLARAREDAAAFARLTAWLCSRLTTQAPAGQVAAELAELGLDDPELAPLQELFTRLGTGSGEPRAQAEAARSCARAARRALDAAPRGARERPGIARFHALLLVRQALLAPGTVDFTEVDDVALAAPEPDPAARAAWPGPLGAQHQVASLVDTVRIFQTADRNRLEHSVARLREMTAAVPGEGPAAQAARRSTAGLLSATFLHASRLQGNHRDVDAGLATARELLAAHHREGTPPPTELRVLAAFLEINVACRGDDPQALAPLIEELTRHHAALAPGHQLRFAVAAALGEAHRALAARTGDPAGLATASRYFRQAAATEQRHVPPLLAPYFPAYRAETLANLVLLEPGREAVGRAVAAVREALAAPGAFAGQEALLRYSLGRALLHAAGRPGEAGLLDQGLAELSRVRELAAQGAELPQLADALTRLAEAHWQRGLRRRSAPDVETSLAIGREALLRLSADVLLQLGAEHGLAVARGGAAQALRLAHRCALTGRRARAVEALELGRGLVLRAAAASRGVPELLKERGRPDLAARWRAEAAVEPLGPGAAPALLDPSAGPQVPSSLRRGVLAALGASSGEGAVALLGVPGLDELAAGLAAAGADALIYLVPGEAPGQPGFALLVRPEPGAAPRTTLLELPRLTQDAEPLKRYLDAVAPRSRALADPALHRSWRAAWDAHWQAALRELCDWAWPAVMGPVLAAVRPRGPRAPRLVLVPCGRLGTVPWHAARTRDPSGGAGRRRYRYACQEAVFSHAASGSQFLRAAARARLPLTGRRVLVADPHLDLVWSEIETQALRATCYADALGYGAFPTAAREPDAPGTPRDLLAALPGGTAPAAVLHLSCHALAGPSPTRSALRLAVPPGGEPDAGQLTVARILDSAARPPDPAGPLVVLSACETDLSTRDHDEALTLATALVAGGAADVVGSRWAVSDGSTALMMTVFHHYLVHRGQAPADALRAAQLWMLDPGREPPPGLPAPLRREAARRDLDQVHLWAAFTHQGNPTAGPGTARANEEPHMNGTEGTEGTDCTEGTDSTEGTDGIDELLERAECFLPALFTPGPRRPPAAPPVAGERERVMRQLAAAERRLAPGDPRLAPLRVRLGTLIGVRYLREAGEGDREEAIRLLRAAREGSAAGLGEDDRLLGTTLLALLLLPMPVPWPEGRMPDFEAMVAWAVRQPPPGPGLVAELAEAERLLTELRAGPLPPGWREQVAQLARAARLVRTAIHSGIAGLPSFLGRIGKFARALPGVPYGDQLQAVLRLAHSAAPGNLPRTAPDSPQTAPDSPRAPSGSPQRPPHSPTTAPASPPDPSRDFAELLMLAEMQVPGTVSTERLGEISSLLARPGDGASERAVVADQALSGLVKAIMALRTGKAEHLAEGAEAMRGVAPKIPGMEHILPGISAAGRLVRGNIEDEDEGLRGLRALASGAAGRPGAPPTKEVRDARLLGRVMEAMLRLWRLHRSPAETGPERERSLRELEEIHAGLLETARDTDPGDEWYGYVSMALGIAEMDLALRRGFRLGELRAGLEKLERALAHEGSPGFLRAWLDNVVLALRAHLRLLEGDPGGVAGLAERVHGSLDKGDAFLNQRALGRASLAMTQLSAYGLTGDRALLDEAIAELERATAELAEEGSDPIRGDVPWELARAYAARAGDGDLARAAAAGLDSLRLVADDVLMQLGAEHALQAAQAGASRGLRIAAWALGVGLLPQAVTALEAGRALVLRAAGAAAGVPERLEALGQRALAEEWRRAAPRSPGAADAPGPFDREHLIPSTLRRRALDALGAERGDLLAVPDLPTLTAALESGGADALVYLIPGQGKADGAALILGRAAGPARAEDAAGAARAGADAGAVLRLPGLSQAGREPLERWLNAAADRAADRPRWEAALDALCDWAGRAVVGPLLRRIGRALGPVPGPYRLVLVPCGNLGVVPWHAARLPQGGYAVERAVFTYAASGAQFAGAAARKRTPPAGRAVLVADPSLSLLWAAEEVTALRRAFYPQARLYGDFPDDPSLPVRGRGTPEEVLAVLPGAPRQGEAASLLHIASHGSAGARPTVSALDLTGPLTVARVLDRAGGPRPGERGPLVVLSACETDLSTRDHDEALTLTTAFVARGATDAVGSRWMTEDSGSALLMAVFHHHLSFGGLAPPDALRAAQLWMLDPARTPPPCLEGHLRREALRPHLERPRVWAPFIHQGNPAPAGPGATPAGGGPGGGRP